MLNLLSNQWGTAWKMKTILMLKDNRWNCFKKPIFSHLSETKPKFYIGLPHLILYFLFFLFHQSDLMEAETLWRAWWITYRWPWTSHPVFPESGWWARWRNLCVRAANIHHRPMNMTEHVKAPQPVQKNKHGRLNSQSQPLRAPQKSIYRLKFCLKLTSSA